MSTKASISISEFPKFNSTHYCKWAEKMLPIFLITQVNGVIQGTVTAPSSPEAEPAAPNMSATPAPTTQALQAFDTLYKWWEVRYSKWVREEKEFNNQNSKALSIIASSLIPSIWKTVHEKKHGMISKQSSTKFNLLRC